MLDISVVICSYNPRPEFLNRALESLRLQTLPRDRWDLILVDNCSAEPLDGRFHLSWHPAARHVREEQLGLTHARLRGIRESTSEIIVFVDDDNVLSPTYLTEAVKIGSEYPFLGAWGGSSIPEFEIQPPTWSQEFFPALALREADIVRWSNTFDDWRAHPCGAGMCLRRKVAELYQHRVSKDFALTTLDRKGGSLMSAGDTDIVYTARLAGLGFGTFPQLSLTHLIPKGRLSQTYLLRLTEGISTSNVLVAQRYARPIEQTVRWKTALRFLSILITKGARPARFYLARKRGAGLGKELLASLSAERKK